MSEIIKDSPEINTFTAAESGTRLDVFLTERLEGLSRSSIQKLISDENVSVNGRIQKKAGFKIQAGDEIEARIYLPEPTPLSPREITLKIVYEDNDVVVLDKPPGLTVHPVPGSTTPTLVNALIGRVPELAEFGDSLRPGIVHRLDKDTSGLMVVAKTLKAQSDLINQFQKHRVLKIYLTLVQGHLTPAEGIIEANIGRHPADRKRMAVVAGGREARSHYRVIKYFQNYSLLEVKLETGRTHQIRVHLSAIGYPVFGDKTYGVKSSLLDRQFLHAHKLGFDLPSSGKHVEFSSELPPDLESVLKELNTPEKNK